MFNGQKRAIYPNMDDVYVATVELIYINVNFHPFYAHSQRNARLCYTGREQLGDSLQDKHTILLDKTLNCNCPFKELAVPQ